MVCPSVAEVRSICTFALVGLLAIVTIEYPSSGFLCRGHHLAVHTMRRGTFADVIREDIRLSRDAARLAEGHGSWERGSHLLSCIDRANDTRGVEIALEPIPHLHHPRRYVVRGIVAFRLHPFEAKARDGIRQGREAQAPVEDIRRECLPVLALSEQSLLPTSARMLICPLAKRRHIPEQVTRGTPRHA